MPRNHNLKAKFKINPTHLNIGYEVIPLLFTRKIGVPLMVDEIELKVAEAMQIDYGKRIVRIDSQARKLLGLTTGDIIQIKGGKGKTTGAIVLPSHPQDEGSNIIRMDGILRQNTGVGLGDRVKISKADAKIAKKLVLAPNQPSRYAPGFADYVKKNLMGKPLTKGDVLSVNVFGTSFPFAVAQTLPTGIVLVNETTEVTLKEEPMKELGKIATISYEDIGGLKDEVQKIREMVELPMRHPELFERLGIEPPKGVLIYGTPGGGKTLLAKAVANESEAHFITINGPEIVSKFVGEAEEKLRNIFQEAEDNAPSIIFIDELDAIAPKREEVVGEVEKRIVSQLLTTMDGLKSRGQVVVIGASVTGDTPILVKAPDGTKLVRIDEFVDSFYAEGEEGFEKPIKEIQALGFDANKSETNFGNSSFKKSAFKSVRGVYRHKVNEIYEINYRGGKIRATGNHSVFVRDRKGVYAKPVVDLKPGECLVELPFKTRTELRSHSFAPLEEIELEVAPAMLKQHYENAVNHEIPMEQIAIAAGVNRTTAFRWAAGARPRMLKTELANSIPSTVSVRPPLCRLLGYYTAEGYARKEVDFCFGTHEKVLITDTLTLMKNLFNAEGVVREVGTRTNLIFYSKILADFFSGECGKGAHNKHIPSWLFEMPREYFLEFLKGYMAGDGYELNYKEKKGLSCTSVSKQLIMELNWLCRMH